MEGLDRYQVVSQVDPSCGLANDAKVFVRAIVTRNRASTSAYRVANRHPAVRNLGQWACCLTQHRNQGSEMSPAKRDKPIPGPGNSRASIRGKTVGPTIPQPDWASRVSRRPCMLIQASQCDCTARHRWLERIILMGSSEGSGELRDWRHAIGISLSPVRHERLVRIKLLDKGLA